MSGFDKYCDNNTRDVVQKRLLNNNCTDKIYHYTSMKVFDILLDLLYSEEDKKKFINNEFVDSIINDKAGDWREEDRPGLYNMLVRIVASYIKNDKFEDEKEARITITPHLAGSKDAQTKIRYFPMDSGILRPYINIKICDKEDKPCLPLKSITVGPSGIQQTIFDSVVHRIKYGESKVYNYLKDKTGFVKNFICYLFEAYCIINNIKDDLVFGFAGWKYKNNKGLKNNISDAIDKLTFSEKDKSTLPKDFESDCKAWIKNNVLAKAVTHDWIQENELYISKFKYKITVKDRTDEAKKDRTKNNDFIVRLKTINQNFFFSKEGILIRKSKIPYIF